MYSSGIQDYRRTSVITADPKRLVLMCYEGAIDNLKIGRQKIIEKDYEAKSKAFVKTQDIINELLYSLDFEKGGSIAKNLDSLYNYMLRRIIHADVNRDMGAIEEVIGMLNELKTAWEEVFYNKDPEIEPDLAEFNEEMRQAAGYVSV